MDKLKPTPIRLYVIAVAMLGAAVIGLSGYRVLCGNPGYHWLILASLTAVTGSMTLRLPGVNSKISVGDTLICTNLVLFGPAAATITAALDGLTGSLRCWTKSRRLEFTTFNTVSMALSVFAGGELFSMLAGVPAAHRGAVGSIQSFLPALGLFAAIYYLANTMLVAAMVALERRVNMFAVWRDKFLWTVVNYVAAAAVAGLVGRSDGSITALMVLTILSVVSAIYISSKSYVEMAEEVHRARQLAAGCLNPIELPVDPSYARDRSTGEEGGQLRALARGVGPARASAKSAHPDADFHEGVLRMRTAPGSDD